MNVDHDADSQILAQALATALACWCDHLLKTKQAPGKLLIALTQRLTGSNICAFTPLAALKLSEHATTYLLWGPIESLSMPAKQLKRVMKAWSNFKTMCLEVF